MKHGYAAACSAEAGWSYRTFSYGIFPLVSTADGKRVKRGKVVVRVVGSVANAAAVEAEARRICNALEAGTYAGPKRVTVRETRRKGI
jgi:hypothetical protein